VEASASTKEAGEENLLIQHGFVKVVVALVGVANFGYLFPGIASRRAAHLYAG